MTNTDRLEGYSWDGKTAIPAHPESSAPPDDDPVLNWITRYGESVLITVATVALVIITKWGLHWW